MSEPPAMPLLRRFGISHMPVSREFAREWKFNGLPTSRTGGSLSVVEGDLEWLKYGDVCLPRRVQYPLGPEVFVSGTFEISWQLAASYASDGTGAAVLAGVPVPGRYLLSNA